MHSLLCRLVSSRHDSLIPSNRNLSNPCISRQVKGHGLDRRPFQFTGVQVGLVLPDVGFENVAHGVAAFQDGAGLAGDPLSLYL